MSARLPDRVALFQPVSPPASLLDLFLQRYANLLRFAESLTRDRREAEDLVQDACVRLLVAPPDVSQVKNVDAYLVAALRNLHTTRTRRRQVRPEPHLSVVDFDSAGFALEAFSLASSLHARDALRTTCRFACARRFTSKTASLFILHFFHEYVRSEISAIAHLRRASVDTGLTRARVEVRAYLDDPGAALQAIGLSEVPEFRVDATQNGDGDDYIARLRAAIFGLRHARCFDAAFLRRLYADTETQIPTQMLGELVACPRCLDAVNRMTQLPLLGDRHPRGAQSLEPEPRRFPIRRDQEQRVCRLAAEQRARVIRAHQPRALRVFVNGFQIGSHDVTAEVTRATHALSGPEPPRIVEVCSEQGICLTTLQVESVPDAAVSQQTAIALDDGRRLELRVLFDDQWPTLQLTYVQPADLRSAEEWDEDASTADSSVSERSDSSTTPRAEGVPPGAQIKGRPRSARNRLDIVWGGLLEALRTPARGRRWSLRLASVLAVLWLLFFTPGSSVSAAELAYRALVRLVDTTWQWLRSTPPVIPAPELPPAFRGNGIVPLSPAPPPAEPTMPTTPAVKQWSPLERIQAEIHALASLQRIEAYLGQEIQFSDGRSGRARVDAVVNDATRRDEVTAILAPLLSDGAIDLRALTPEELAARGARRRSPERPPETADGRETGLSTPPDLRVYEFDRDRIAAADTLRMHLGDQQAVRDFANDILDHSRRASVHAWSLQHLSQRFDLGLVAQLPATDRDVLVGLVEQHAREFDHEIEVLSTALAPIFRQGERGDVSEPDAAMEFWTLVERLLDLNRMRDEAVQQTLVVGRTSQPGPGLASGAFWEALDASRRVARQLRRQPRLSRN